MFNPNQKQKMESESLSYSKEPISMFGPKSIQKIISKIYNKNFEESIGWIRVNFSLEM